MKYIPIHPRTSSIINIKGTMPRDILIKLLKIIDERNNLKSYQRTKNTLYSEEQR